MTPNGQQTKTTQRTVFDLQKFDDVKLVKEFAVPQKPASIEEALAAVGNDQTRLLEVIHSGLTAAAANEAYNNIEGFKVVNEDGEPAELYVRDVPVLDKEGKPVLNEDGTPKMEKSGKYADEEMGKKINAAVLSLAKLQGYSKDLSPAEKQKLKDSATNFLRSNPAMLASIAG